MCVCVCVCVCVISMWYLSEVLLETTRHLQAQVCDYLSTLLVVAEEHHPLGWLSFQVQVCVCVC